MSTSNIETALKYFGQTGQALMEVIIATGIMGVLMLVMIEMQLVQTKENKAISEKLASMELYRLVSSNIAIPARCNSIFNAANVDASTPLTFDASAVSVHHPYVVKLNSAFGVQAGGLISPSLPWMSLNSLTAARPGIQLVVTDPSTAELAIHFDQTKLVRAVHDFTFQLSLQSSGPLNATVISGCVDAGSSSLATGQCPAIPGCGVPIGFPTQRFTKVDWWCPGAPINCGHADSSHILNMTTVCADGAWSVCVP